MLLPVQVHLFLHLEVLDVQIPVLLFSPLCLLPLLLHLNLYSVKMLLSFSSLHIRFDKVALKCYLLTHAHLCHSLLLGSLLLELFILFFLIVVAHVLYRYSSSLHQSCPFIESRELVDLLNLVLYLTGKFSVKLLFVTLLIILLLHLIVIICLHILTLLHHLCISLLVFDMIRDDILKGQHVPCVVLLRFNMSWLPVLERCLCIIWWGIL